MEKTLYKFIHCFKVWNNKNTIFFKKLINKLKKEEIVFLILAVDIFLFIRSSENPILGKISSPNPIIFNLSSGFITGVFVYFLTTYIPNLKNKKIKKEITYKLINKITNKIDSLFSLILKHSKTEDVLINKMSESDFVLICKKCELEDLGGITFISNAHSMIEGSLRDRVLCIWEEIVQSINEIKNIASYIEPDVYSEVLKIKNSDFSNSVFGLRHASNKDLEKWGSCLYSLFLLSDSLKRINTKK